MVTKGTLGYVWFFEGIFGCDGYNLVTIFDHETLRFQHENIKRHTRPYTPLYAPKPQNPYACLFR